jgi:hypothetical protein
MYFGSLAAASACLKMAALGSSSIHVSFISPPSCTHTTQKNTKKVKEGYGVFELIDETDSVTELGQRPNWPSADTVLTGCL